ncbi:MAG: 5-oxoprolinase [Betaproteobacteria bacterium RIFCSPLOWO2_02_FULL_65_24]|nr:MAG: 5-oxoprolinase [Betaproteobacteria bacterium RIFCSPLOWO2_02_FULL_65_24]
MQKRVRAVKKPQPARSRRAREARRADPILTEIVRNGVMAVTGDMKTNLTRTAYNLIIYEALDFTVGLFTPQGETVSIGLGLPMFTRGMAETVKASVAHFGIDRLAPGDILITNDAYITGSHLNHVTLTLPIFHEDRLVGFSCCMAHWLNIGGVLNGLTTDIYSEGLQIPILKLQSAGRLNQDLIDIIMMNVRIPERARGDLRAQMTAVKTGEKGYLELVKRYGREGVLESIEEILHQSERAARARTLSIPDGVYEAESFMDDDGIDIGRRIPVKVKVIVRGDEMTIDLTECSPQVRGFYNSGPSTGVACAQVAFKCLTSPTDYPINEGSFRPLKVIVPPGRFVSAVRPAPMRLWMCYPMTVVDTVFKALAPAIPQRTIAGHHACLILVQVTGIDRRDGRFFIGSVGHTGGGWGAKATEDGMCVTVAMNDGDTHTSPVEMVETKYPFMVDYYRLVPDSGGAGRFRGGLGGERRVVARQDITISTTIDRAVCAPWGLHGGLDGFPNKVALQLNGELKDDLPNAKVPQKLLKGGDAVIVRGGGGGGFGPPHERPAQNVQDDVRQGYVSVEAARELYGVALDAQTLEIDQPATARLRARLASPGRQAA